MKFVQKKISLEQFKSRMHGIIPAYFRNGNGGNKYYFNGKVQFDDDKKRIPYTNYNLVPLNIRWNHGKYSDKCMSYNTIASWFHFLEFYVNLLSKHGCLDRNYNDAAEYFNYERSDYSLEECLAFDGKVKVICGEPTSTLFDLAKSVYNEMVKKYFPRFEIPNELQGEWNKKYLTINEAYYWIKWLSRFTNVSEVKNCKNNDSCCECERYFKLGGKDMIDKLNEFLNSINLVDNACPCSYLNIPIQLTVNIDNLGEMTIFCEDWEGGVKYTDGTVVRYDDKDWVFNKENDSEGYYGSMFSKTYHEFYFGLESAMTNEERTLYEDVNNDVEWSGIEQYIRRIDTLDNAEVESVDEGEEAQNNIISGYTESKLSSFITSTDVVYDNLGNRLPGILNTPLTEGAELEIPYKEKTSVHLTKIGEDEYWGDYLYSINITDVDDNTKECVFTYYMGCTIPKGDEEPTDGVKYIDKTTLVKKECKYYIDDFTFYTLNYYDIEHGKINYKNKGNDYNSDVDGAEFYVQMVNEKENGFTAFPLLREEYMVGSSSMQNIENDIYINRGTARSFDYHLKLMEVNSLESLEQYGNGYFNIIKN